MRKLWLLLLLPLCIHAQQDSKIQLGESHDAVLSELPSVWFPQFYSISDSKNRIRVLPKAGSGFPGEPKIYDFEGGKLKRVYMIMGINPTGTWQMLYQMSSEKHGEPKTVTVDGVKLTYWNQGGPDRAYLYFATSTWFQKECLFMLSTNEHFETMTEKQRKQIRILRD